MQSFAFMREKCEKSVSTLIIENYLEIFEFYVIIAISRDSYIHDKRASSITVVKGELV